MPSDAAVPPAPRRTDTAEIADLYLPIQPGTDVMLFNGMLHLMLWEGWTDAAWIAAHTQRLKVSSLVLCDALRHPAVLAREAVSWAAELHLFL